MKVRTGALVALLGSGCVWQGYVSPTEQDFQVVAEGCPPVGVQNLSQDDGLIVLDAIIKACAVLRSPELEQSMAGESLLPTCDPGAARVSGSEALTRLRSLERFSVRVAQPWCAEAVTDIANRRVAVGPGRVERWRRGERGALVNTLVHEMTHLIPRDDGGFRYEDRGHGSASCPDRELVSYRTGDLAQAAFEARSAAGRPPNVPMAIESAAPVLGDGPG